MERTLEGRVALVTGAGTRLGRALAEDLGAAGAAVALHCHRSTQGAAQVAEALGRGGRKAVVLQADLTEPDAAARLADEATRALGRVDVLVNNAAVFHRADFLDTSAEQFDAQWSLNSRAPYFLTQEVVRRMGPHGGDVVNVLDVGGVLQTWSHYSAYSMTKAALAALTRCLAVELAPSVRVNGVAPGTVLPPESMTAAAVEGLRAAIPLQRVGRPEDVCLAVRFLLTGAPFITGHILPVDGGRSVGAVRR